MLVKNIVPKDDVKQKSISNVTDIIKKIRKERKDVSAENRYEVVNCSRGLKESDNDSESLFDLVDLVKANDKEKDIGYTYDLYTSVKPDFDVSMLDNLVRYKIYIIFLYFHFKYPVFIWIVYILFRKIYHSWYTIIQIYNYQCLTLLEK